MHDGCRPANFWYFVMPMRALGLLLLLLLPLSLNAELPPSAYDAMQKKAGEYLNIEVLRVDIEPGDNPNEQKVQIAALVSSVDRTSSDVKQGDFISISYTVTEREKGWVGAGEVPILNEKDQTVAYLTKIPDGDGYAPAAGRMSFSNF